MDDRGGTPTGRDRAGRAAAHLRASWKAAPVEPAPPLPEEIAPAVAAVLALPAPRPPAWRRSFSVQFRETIPHLAVILAPADPSAASISWLAREVLRWIREDHEEQGPIRARFGSRLPPVALLFVSGAPFAGTLVPVEEELRAASAGGLAAGVFLLGEGPGALLASNPAGLDLPLGDVAWILSLPAAESARGEAFLARTRGTPWVSGALLAACLALFAGCMIATDPFSGTDVAVLLRFGADSRARVLGGEAWRTVSAMFLHIGVVHLLVNGWALLVFGRLLEGICGRPAFLAIYVLAGIGGSLASITRDAVGAGASGAIFGLLGLGIVFGIRHRAAIPPPFRRAFGTALVPCLLANLLLGAAIPVIDQRAHLGGLAAGALLGLVIPPGPQGERTPAARWLVRLAFAFALAALAYGAAGLARSIAAGAGPEASARAASRSLPRYASSPGRPGNRTPSARARAEGTGVAGSPRREATRISEGERARRFRISAASA